MKCAVKRDFKLDTMYYYVLLGMYTIFVTIWQNYLTYLEKYFHIYYQSSGIEINSYHYTHEQKWTICVGYADGFQPSWRKVAIVVTVFFHFLFRFCCSKCLNQPCTKFTEDKRKALILNNRVSTQLTFQFDYSLMSWFFELKLSYFRCI